jgi:hypothetical protein
MSPTRKRTWRRLWLRIRAEHHRDEVSGDCEQLKPFHYGVGFSVGNAGYGKMPRSSEVAASDPNFFAESMIHRTLARIMHHL